TAECQLLAAFFHHECKKISWIDRHIASIFSATPSLIKEFCETKRSFWQLSLSCQAFRLDKIHFCCSYTIKSLTTILSIIPTFKAVGAIGIASEEKLFT